MSQQTMLYVPSIALTSTSGTPAEHQQRLLKINVILYHICSDIFSSLGIVLEPSNQTCNFHPPCPDRSRYRLCVSLPSNISSVYLPLSFSVGFRISIQTFCILLPVFVLASWSTLLSLHGRETYENHILIKKMKITDIILLFHFNVCAFGHQS